MIATASLAGLPLYQDNRVVRWVFYYLTGVVNCTPGLLYACEYHKIRPEVVIERC